MKKSDIIRIILSFKLLFPITYLLCLIKRFRMWYAKNLQIIVKQDQWLQLQLKDEIIGYEHVVHLTNWVGFVSAFSHNDVKFISNYYDFALSLVMMQSYIDNNLSKIYANEINNIVLNSIECGVVTQDLYDIMKEIRIFS